MSISSVYEQYFGLEEHPFSITPDPRFVYLSDSHREALEHLQQGATGGANGFVLLTGEVGAGKTTICRSFLEQVPPKTEVALILNPVLTLNEFLQTICDELDLAIDGNRESNKNLIDHLNRFLLQVYAVGQKTILIVDEAQNLTHELLEQIRLLTNLETNTDKLLQIFLIGQPELRDMLDRPDMLQVSQRITSRYHLGPLNKTETREYILKRLEVAGTSSIEFTSAAIRRVFAFSKGVPRLINVLCDKALLSAYENSTNKITDKIVREAERRTRGNMEAAGGGSFKVAASFVVAVSALTLVLGGAYWANLGGVRSWIDDGQSDVVAVEPAGTAIKKVPPSRPLTAQVAPTPLGDGARAPVDAGMMPPERIASDSGAGAPAGLDASFSPVEPVDVAASSSPQIDVAQVNPTDGAGLLSSQKTAATASAEIDRSAIADRTAATAESDAAGSSSALERTQNERVAGVGQQSDSAQRGAAGLASRSESAENETDAASQEPVDAVQGEVLARVDDARETASKKPTSETARDLVAATPGPVPEESKYGPPGRAQKGAVRGEMVARIDSVDPMQSSTQRAGRSKPKEGSTSTRTPGARDRDPAQQPSLPSSRAKRPSEQTLTGYTQKFAERKLLSMWGVNSEPPPGADFCQYAQRNGLKCLTDGRGLNTLYVFNRPAIIALKVGDLDSYGLVIKATPDKVVLNVLGRQHVIPANVLPNVWDGRFLVLWRGPNGLKGNLVKGATGQPVVQLRKIIDQIDGRSTSGDVYDADLVARVKQFQSDVGLTPDGIVGPRTQIVMQNKLAEIEKK